MRLWKPTYSLLKDAVQEFIAYNVPRLGASLAFYAVLSISPLLLIVVAIAGTVFGNDTVTSHIVTEMQSLLGPQAAEAIQAIIRNAQTLGDGFFAILIGVGTIAVSSTLVFAELQAALNIIWKVEPEKTQGFAHLVRARLISFAIVIGTGFLLLVSLSVSAVIAAMGEYFVGYIPQLAPLLEAVNLGLTFAVVTVLFAMMFRILPDRHVKWRNVWIGAFLTSLLFTLGKFGIGLYLGRSSVASAYGAAGSMIILLLWIYYSAQIFLFGAMLTRIYTERREDFLPPKKTS